MTGRLLFLPARLYVRGARLVLHAAEDLTGRALSTTLRLAGVLESLRPGSDRTSASSPPEPAERTAETSAARERPSAERATAPLEHTAGRPPRDARNGGPTPAVRPSDAGAPTGPRSADVEEIASDPRREPPATDIVAREPATEEGSEPLASARLEREGFTAAVDFDAEVDAPAHVSEEPVVVREEAERGAEDGAGASITVDPPWAGYERMGVREVIARLSGASAAELGAVQLYEGTHRKRQTVLQAVERQLRSAGRDR